MFSNGTLNIIEIYGLRMSKLRLKSRISLITGGSGGFGIATCQRFTEEGSTVIDPISDKGTLIDDILVLDGMAEMFVLGCTVDYIKEFGGSYLTVNNPNAHSSCGCGTSFSIKT